MLSGTMLRRSKMPKSISCWIMVRTRPCCCFILRKITDLSMIYNSGIRALHRPRLRRLPSNLHPTRKLGRLPVSTPYDSSSFPPSLSLSSILSVFLLMNAPLTAPKSSPGSSRTSSHKTSPKLYNSSRTHRPSYPTSFLQRNRVQRPINRGSPRMPSPTLNLWSTVGEITFPKGSSNSPYRSTPPSLVVAATKERRPRSGLHPIPTGIWLVWTLP